MPYGLRRRRLSTEVQTLINLKRRDCVVLEMGRLARDFSWAGAEAASTDPLQAPDANEFEGSPASLKSLWRLGYVPPLCTSDRPPAVFTAPETRG